MNEHIKQLIENLQKHTLDPRFEKYGNFVLNAADGGIHFFRNFYDYSAVFHVVTTDRALCEHLITLIKENQKSAGYLAAVREHADQRERQHPNGYIESTDGPYAAY